MRLTGRDIRLVKDVALSHVLSRDQIVQLGYFGSITRTNTRLRELRLQNHISVLSTPFFGQHLYVAGCNASEIVGERIALLLTGRSPTPRFIQHALAVTDSRVALLARGFSEWRFEAQLRHTFSVRNHTYEVRPDGALMRDGCLVLLEIDLGHVAPRKFREKLLAYEHLVNSREGHRIWQVQSIAVLTLTTGRLRQARLARLSENSPALNVSFRTFSDVGIELLGGWS